MSHAVDPSALLVVRGRSRAWLVLPLLGMLTMPLYVAAALFSVKVASDAGLFTVLPTGGAFVVLGSFAVLVAVGGMLGTLRLLRTTGTATLAPHGVLWKNDFMPVLVPWSDVTGYRDDHASYITLVARSTRSTSGSREHHIPAIDERDRVAVLVLLDARGLRRLEARWLPRRLREAPGDVSSSPPARNH
ncbi:MAG: hypothetical protein ACAI25_18695 [Planctomycetota bacterium]